MLRLVLVPTLWVLFIGLAVGSAEPVCHYLFSY